MRMIGIGIAATLAMFVAAPAQAGFNIGALAHGMPQMLHLVAGMQHGYPMESHGMPYGGHEVRPIYAPPRGEIVIRHGPSIEHFGGNVIRGRGYGNGVVIEQGGYARGETHFESHVRERRIHYGYGQSVQTGEYGPRHAYAYRGTSTSCGCNTCNCNNCCNGCGNGVQAMEYTPAEPVSPRSAAPVTISPTANIPSGWEITR